VYSTTTRVGPEYGGNVWVVVVVAAILPTYAVHTFDPAERHNAASVDNAATNKSEPLNHGDTPSTLSGVAYKYTPHDPAVTPDGRVTVTLACGLSHGNVTPK
jgi:hypothetical protein